MIKWTDTEATRATGKVIARTGRTHTVATDEGRTMLADSATQYNQGNRVTVVAGAIIGPAGAAPIIKNYQQ